MNQLTALLLNLVAPGVWSASEISPADRAVSKAQGGTLTVVDLVGVSDKAAMMDALADGLGFGDYFGKNFDALEECLLDSDLKGVVAFTGGSALNSAEPAIVETLNSVLNDVCSQIPGLSFVWVATNNLLPVVPNFWVQSENF